MSDKLKKTNREITDKLSSLNEKDNSQLITHNSQFLELPDYPLLTNKGKISMLEAKLKAESEYEKYRVIQDKNYISDFDREINKNLSALDKMIGKKKNQ